MSEPQAPREDGEQEPGVLGNLPRRRPGVRSPRRQEAGARTSRAAPRAEPAGEPGTAGGAGVEDLVRAGAAVATEAAAVGLRLAGHALRGIRGAARRS